MRDTFRWERDTENYRRYCSERKDPGTGKYRVIYFPKSMGDLPKILPDLIASDSDHGIQCCERDNDFDGNCSIHEAPGVLRQREYESSSHRALGLGYDVHRELAKSLHHAELYGLRDPYHFQGTQTGRFSSRRPLFQAAPRMIERHDDKIKELDERVEQNEIEIRRLKERQGILFQAVEKIIKLIGWKPGRRVKKVVPPGTYDAEIISVEQKGHFMTVDMEIKRTS